MNLRILLVDDEPSVLNAMRRMLHIMKNEWKIYTVVSGEQALNSLNSGEFDMIITDMKMPGMNGAELLQKVKEQHPSVIRIVLSGYSDNDLILKSSNFAHQFLAKPLEAETLKEKIELIYTLQSHLNNKEIANLVNGIKNLPTLPSVYLQIEEEIRKPDSSLKVIEHIISKDIVMTTKILQVVNSAYFGLPQIIINPLQALNFLGIDILKSLVLVVHLFSVEKDSQYLNEQIALLSENSFKVAELSKRIALKLSTNMKFVEEVFTGALLHNIGKLVIWQLDDYFAKIEREIKKNSVSDYEAEYNVFNTSHAEIGAYLLGIWGLPTSLIEIACYHHKPSDSINKQISPLTIVHAANHILFNDELDLKYINELSLSAEIPKWALLNKEGGNNTGPA